MGEKVLEWLHRIITGPQSRIFWAIVIIAIIIAVVVYPYVDANYLYYSRIEKRIDNLQDLVELSGSSIEESEELNAEYQSILDELGVAREKNLSSATFREDTIEELRIKFFTGAGLFYFVALIVLVSKQKTEKWTFKRIATNFCSMALCLGIGTLIGWIFTMIPTLGTVEINGLLAIVVEIFVVYLIFTKPSKKSQ